MKDFPFNKPRNRMKAPAGQNSVLEWRKKTDVCSSNVKSSKSCTEDFRRPRHFVWWYTCFQQRKVTSYSKWKFKINTHPHVFKHSAQAGSKPNVITLIHRSFRLELQNGTLYVVQNACCELHEYITDCKQDKEFIYILTPVCHHTLV